MAKYSEKVKVSVNSTSGILFILLFIVGVMGITSLLKQLKNQLLAGYISIGILLIMIVFAFKVINRFISEYEFVISGSRFKVSRITGKRSTREVINIHLKQIDYIVSTDELSNNRELNKNVSKKYNLTLVGLKRDKLIGFYKEGNKVYSFTFQPSEKMRKFLINELGNDKVIL